MNLLFGSTFINWAHEIGIINNIRQAILTDIHLSLLEESSDSKKLSTF